MTGGRRTLAAAIASAAASVSLYPIFTGTLWFWAGLGSVAVVAAVSLATSRRPLPVAVCFLASLAGLLLYLNLAFANARSLFHVLPTPASARLLWDLAGQGFDQAARYAPPVPELHGMVLLAAGGIGFAALLTDLIAVRLARAALGGLPLLVLFIEPFTLSVARGFAGTTIAFCVGVAGYLALLSSEARDRIREWEHPQASASGSDEPDTRTLAAAGRRVGFASVIVALFLPLVLPGLHMTRLFGGGQPGIGGAPGGAPGASGGGAAGAGFPDPNTQLSQELKMTNPANVLVYTTDAPVPNYLQVYVLDRLTSDGWRIFSRPESLVSADPRLPAPPGLTSATPVTTVSTSVAISPGVGADELGALPVPYPAVTVSAPGTVRADRATLMVLDPSVALGGLKYSVTSLNETPSPQALNAAPSASASADGMASYLGVPASYDSLYPLAESVVRRAGARTAFEEAVALQNWLSDGTFAYTLNAPSVVNARGLEYFLTTSRRGYCQQFSFAMAALARLLGIPSRVAYGFTSGTSIGDNEWLVTTHDAHAWPELYFPGSGWLRFEPTPSGGNGQGTATTPSYTLATGNSLAGGISAGTAPTAGASAPASSGSQAELRHQLGLEFSGLSGTVSGGTSVARRSGGATTNPWEIAGLVLAGLLIVAITAPVCVRAAIRRRRWRGGLAGGRRPGSGSPAGWEPSARDIAWAHAAWRELRDDLTDYSAGYRPSDSPRAVAARASADLALAEPARAALGRIALAEERARYAAAPVDGSRLRRDSDLVRRAIAAAVPRGTRWRARLAPVSVLRPALGAVAATTDLYRGARRTPGRAGSDPLARLRRGLSAGRRLPRRRPGHRD
jgi:transglutaminase-like putative cysteine protease